MPEGADAVVMQEDVRPEGSEIFIDAEVEAGEFVRRRGSDLVEGQKILGTGERLQSQTLALLAAQGVASKEIASRLYLSVRTVNNHLQSVYTKLGVVSRTELADALALSDPTGD